ncbi:MAG TPA: TIGR02996 domain-containing protein [Gemmataceae bacterium]|nr:TIGR02996 domain-containing protein [Gemmataceae bacterium]
MTEREALLEAVLAAPADDAPRLVYADWLDEHGEPAQAAFIRAQLELARQKPDTAEHDRVTESLLDLWDRFLAELRPAVPSDLMLLPSDFRRGFPATAIQLPQVSAFRDQSPFWWPRLPIRAVSVDLTPWNVGEFVRVPYLARVRELVLIGEDPHGKVIPRLVRCHYLENLRVLDLSQFPFSEEAAEALAGTEVFRNVAELRLPYSFRPNRGIARKLRERYGDDVCRF